MTSTSIQDAFKERILVMDGAMGTALQDQQLTADCFGGEQYEGCNEYLVISKPEAISKVHEAYLAAGADIIETNTFGGTDFVLGEFGLSDQVGPINTKAVELALAACQAYSTPEKPRFVAGSMGPTTKALSVTGGISFEELAQSFSEQAYYLVAAGVDYLLIETALDTLNIKAAYIGILAAFEKAGRKVPIAISGTIETMGTMLAGQGVEALYASVSHMSPLYIGLNCATGPAFMRDHIRTLANIANVPIAVVPNAGIPNEEGRYLETPESMSEVLGSFIQEGWVNVIGGCCDTTPAHIKAFADLARPQSPRGMATEQVSRISGIDPLVIETGSGPYIVGERTNVIGSRKFKEMISNEEFEAASEIARKQVKAGAHIIDVCLSNPDRDEKSDMVAFLEKVSKMVKAPLMVDTQVPEVFEAACQLIQGKCILNSVNLEDGEEAFEALLPIVKRYGAAVVVGCIEGEMAVSAEEKLRVAKVSYDLLTQKYQIPEEDIIFDPLVFPCGTGDEAYFGSGFQTIEGVRLIKEAYPKCRTTLGISNVSFGLPAAGREVLNAVFVYHCTKAGLDTAIVNSEKLVRYSQITDEEKRLCDDLLWYRTEDGNDPVANFTAYFRTKKVETVTIDRASMSVDERLAQNIIDGTKEYLIENLDEALAKAAPLDVINGPLMAGMGTVGKLFNDNELIVAEVLQSAEVMKAAVAYLEPKMDKKDSVLKGTMVLATVKGDVHDIGKNLVQIILSNNGYKVVDLGIKCLPETLIQAIKTHEPDVVGLSGLLVKSAQQMIVTAKDFKAAGISVPIVVGGAALTELFTRKKIQPEYDGTVIYAKDAMNGLDIINQITNPEKASEFLSSYRAESGAVMAAGEDSEAPKKAPAKLKEKRLVYEYDPAEFEQAPGPVIVAADLGDLFGYINRQMLLGHHLGLKGNIKKKIKENDPKTVSLMKQIETVKSQIIEQGILKAKGMYQFYKVKVSDTQLQILSDDASQVQETFTFPRQEGGYQYCLTDFVHPDQVDTVCFFVVTSGQEILDYANQLKAENRFLESHIAAALALESAEAFAERTHQQIRAKWGFADEPSMDIDDIFKLNYRSRRYSFGYPACPDLAYQAQLWSLMAPDQSIGVELCEDFMMSPDGSVSALVFHHPQAVYFRS
ncbi:MAG: methionine synthase [Actinobacteria bacterium]|nr:methionine synthase [Actinomycetota bacterium]